MIRDCQYFMRIIFYDIRMKYEIHIIYMKYIYKIAYTSYNM